MQVPFVDLRVQYDNIKDSIDKAIAEVISKTAFIGGEYVKAFEKQALLLPVIWFQSLISSC